MPSQYKTLKVTQQNAVWTLSIHRPEVLNALNSQVLDEMGEVLRELSEMDFEHARALLITGSGEKAFVAGADIKEISELSDQGAQEFARKGQTVFQELGLLKIPVIALINGFALGGGCELALACDFMIAAENAKFGLPEVSLGLIPGFGGTVRLSRAIGLRKAREMIYTGQMISSLDALACGLVNYVVPLDQLQNKANEILNLILQKSPFAVGAAKKSILRSWDLEIEAAQVLEAQIFSELFQTTDVQEGTKAFLEKRKPIFNLK